MLPTRLQKSPHLLLLGYIYSHHTNSPYDNDETLSHLCHHAHDHQYPDQHYPLIYDVDTMPAPPTLPVLEQNASCTTSPSKVNLFVDNANSDHKARNKASPATTRNKSDDEKIKPVSDTSAKPRPLRQKSTLEIDDLNMSSGSKYEMDDYTDESFKEKLLKLEEAKKKECENLQMKKIELEFQLIERQHRMEIELLKRKLAETERAMTSIIAKMEAIPSQPKVSHASITL